MTHQKFLFDRNDVSTWLAGSGCQLFELCIQKTIDHICLVEFLNTPLKTPYQNTPYHCISNDESGGGDSFDVVSLN